MKQPACLTSSFWDRKVTKWGQGAWRQLTTWAWGHRWRQRGPAAEHLRRLFFLSVLSEHVPRQIFLHGLAVFSAEQQGRSVPAAPAGLKPPPKHTLTQETRQKIWGKITLNCCFFSIHENRAQLYWSIMEIWIIEQVKKWRIMRTIASIRDRRHSSRSH